MGNQRPFLFVARSGQQLKRCYCRRPAGPRSLHLTPDNEPGRTRFYETGRERQTGIRREHARMVPALKSSEEIWALSGSGEQRFSPGSCRAQTGDVLSLSPDYLLSPPIRPLPSPHLPLLILFQVPLMIVSRLNHFAISWNIDLYISYIISSSNCGVPDKYVLNMHK